MCQAHFEFAFHERRDYQKYEKHLTKSNVLDAYTSLTRMFSLGRSIVRGISAAGFFYLKGRTAVHALRPHMLSSALYITPTHILA